MSTIQSNETAMAINGLAASIQHAINSNDSNASAKETAWEIITTLWASGETKDIVPALIQSQVDEHRFLAELLCRIWAKYLGDSPKVMGSYIAEHEDWTIRIRAKDLDPQQLSTTRLLIHCGCLHPPLEGPSKDVMAARAWSHIHRAPQSGLWTDPLLTLDTSGDASQRIRAIVHDAKDKQLDLDWVVTHSLHALPEGVVGFGQSLEARAFLFCYISSAYDFGHDVVEFELPSPRSHEFLPALRISYSDVDPELPAEAHLLMPRPWSLNIFLEQMCPILESFPSRRLVATTTQAPNKPQPHERAPSTRLHTLHPFWIFTIDLALQLERKSKRAVWEMLGPLLSPACVHYEHIHLPSPPNLPATTPKGPIPLMNIVASIIAGNCYYEGAATEPRRIPVENLSTSTPATSEGSMRSVRAVPVPASGEILAIVNSEANAKRKSPVFGRTHIERTVSVRLIDVGVALQSWPDSFITKAWNAALPGLLTALAYSIINAKPEMYSRCVQGAAGAMVDVYRYDDVLGNLDQEQVQLFWLRLVAQCGEYTEGFQEAMVERLDRKSAEKIFSVFDLLDPFADDDTKKKVAPLQKIYAEKAYASAEDLPPHLVDRFVMICIGLARRKTAIAQALADSGFVALLTAIQDSVYEYPEAQDLQPPDVRMIVRKQMCKEAFDVLAERL